ncbi:MAG: SDR family oxidoreductase [Anaerolineales bacterium]|nr:SDR family oxidoreductase [Anaerolineales bacterium]
MDLPNKVVVITGAGRGLGAATAELCAKNGAKVVASDINDEWGHATVSRLQAQGLDVSYMHADVSKEAEVEALVKFAVDKYDMTAEAWDRQIRVNLTGVFYGCKHAIRQFLAQGGGGSIVNIGSISAVVGMPEQPGYCASKGGVFQLTRQIAIDYAKENIRCNTIGPGSIEGEFVDIYLNNQSNPTTARDVIVGNHPIGRMATPFEIAEAIMFMLSDRASFVTGANLQVDGAYSTK